MNKQEMIRKARTLKEINRPELGEIYRGKVRDNYFKSGNIIMIATDRISCFDHVLSRQVPFKGQVLTQIMEHQADGVADIIPHNAFAMPDPQVLIVKEAKPYDVEMVIRGYITGSLWRDYVDKGPEQAGAQYGIVLPSGLEENQKFDEPIVTPTTKAKPESGSTEEHHDEPVSEKEITSPVLLRNIKGVGKKDEPNPFYIETSKYQDMKERTIQVFKKGQDMALNGELILVDTKYEFGDLDGKLCLIDEVHTPDSSRFWHSIPYYELFKAGKKQKSLSKEFVREYLKDQGYDKAVGKASLVDLTPEIIYETASRYISLYEILTTKEFIPGDMSRPLEERIMDNLKGGGYV